MNETYINKNHDDVLFEMLKQCKTLPKFLDGIFGFLQRRTDFYVTTDEYDAAVGLPEGLAEKLVRHTFYKWRPRAPDTVFNESDIPTATEEMVTVEAGETVAVSSTTEDDGNSPKFNTSEYYNGSEFENYCWSQSISEVFVYLRVPENVTKKDLDISIYPSKISVMLKDGTYLLDGELCQKCKANDTIWSLDGRKLEIHLDKCRDIWWNCLVKSEQELDISKIDCTRPYEDLPQEAQAKIEELQWNQEQKRLGLPTSEELSCQEKLRKAWNAEGSPFSGPFDPSSVSFG